MQLTKYNHSCVLVDDGQTKLLFDPGNWSDVPDISVDGIIITHVHQDHFDMSKLNPLLAKNSPRIITNSEVKAELDREGISCEVVEEGAQTTLGTFQISAHGNEHAIIHPTMPKFQNTGYLINGKLFHPGDALFVPPTQIDVLLLPVVAPWSKISETLDYIEAVKPQICFPIHDAFLRPEAQSGLFYRLAGTWTEKLNAQFIQPECGKAYEISI